MKRLSLYVFLFLMFSLFTSHSFAAKKHKIYKKLPCYFNGVKVGPSAQKDSGVRGGRCCVGCSAYKEKRGTSMEVRRGTPVVAITDMKVIKIEDSSAEQRSTSYLKDKYGVVAGKDHFTGGKELIKPFDALRIYFLDTNGNIILYYHLHETPLVPGFKKGKCKIPLQYEQGRKKMKPEDCGGYSEDLIKNNFNVKKGQVIGTSGHAYNPHFSLGIAIPADEGIRNYILEINKNKSIEGTEYGMKKEFFEKPYQFTTKYMKFTAPQRDFKWENLPTDSDAYLFPVMSKKYLKEIGYND
jgi:hypothetical protein